MASNIIYFLAGMLTVIIFFSIKPKSEQEPKIQKKWSKIDKIEYTYDVDHSFKNTFTARDIFEIMNEVMVKKFENDCVELKKVVINSGDYSINCTTTVRLTKRE